MELIYQGFGYTEEAIGMARIALGTFFACSGWNKVMCPKRHASLVETLKRDHVPLLKINEWWVPWWELIGGAALIVGLVPVFNAAVLLCICMVACLAEAKERVHAYSPINKADEVADYLYLPEVVYIFPLLVIIASGGGAWRLFS